MLLCRAGRGGAKWAVQCAERVSLFQNVVHFPPPFHMFCSLVITVCTCCIIYVNKGTASVLVAGASCGAVCLGSELHSKFLVSEPQQPAGVEGADRANGTAGVGGGEAGDGEVGRTATPPSSARGDVRASTKPPPVPAPTLAAQHKPPPPPASLPSPSSPSSSPPSLSLSLSDQEVRSKRQRELAPHILLDTAPCRHTDEHLPPPPLASAGATQETARDLQGGTSVNSVENTGTRIKRRLGVASNFLQYELVRNYRRVPSNATTRHATPRQQACVGIMRFPARSNPLALFTAVISAWCL